MNCLLGTGLEGFWAAMQAFQSLESANGRTPPRTSPRLDVGTHTRGLKQAFDEHPQVAAQIGSVTQQVLDGQLPASTAARQLLALFQKPAGH